MWHVMWLQGATEWWVMGLAQMKHTSTSPSVPSSWVSFLILKFGSLLGCGGFGSSSVGSAGGVCVCVPPCGWCGPPLPLPLPPRPLPRPLLPLPLWPSPPLGPEGALSGLPPPPAAGADCSVEAIPGLVLPVVGVMMGCVRSDRRPLNPPVDGKTLGSVSKTRPPRLSTLGSKLEKAEGQVAKLSGASMLTGWWGRVSELGGF
jgi:hypothetical protein